MDIHNVITPANSDGDQSGVEACWWSNFAIFHILEQSSCTTVQVCECLVMVYAKNHIKTTKVKVTTSPV